jgi:hypothetical protein
MLPFHIQTLFGKRIIATGYAIPKDDGIHLVVHEGETPEHVLDAKTISFHVPWQNLETIEARQGILGDTLILGLTSAGLLPDFPAADDKQIELSLLKKDRDQLERFTKETEAFRSGRKRTGEVEEMLDDIRDFLES